MQKPNLQNRKIINPKDSNKNKENLIYKQDKNSLKGTNYTNIMKKAEKR